MKGQRSAKKDECLPMDSKKPSAGAGLLREGIEREPFDRVLYAIRPGCASTNRASAVRLDVRGPPFDIHFEWTLSGRLG